MVTVLVILVIGVLSFVGYSVVKSMMADQIATDTELAELDKVKMPDNKRRKTDAEAQKSESKPKKEAQANSSEAIKSAKSEQQTSESHNGSATTQHKVGSGENLYRIAIRYGVTQVQLKEINGSKAEKLKAGSNLTIPVKALHTVEQGESYSTLSDKYNVKIDRICTANNISASKPLKPGQKLIIPFK